MIVSATRTPVPGEVAGADANSLGNAELTTLQPIAAADAIRVLPGAVINTSGQHGGLASLFVRGGASTYNKVIVDGVAIDNPGLTFDFGTLPLTEADRLEFVRGAQSTLYGSDAMTSVIQVWTRTGSTPSSRASPRRRWRKLRYRQRQRIALRRVSPLRLQLLRQPVQHQRPGRQRCVLQFASGRERRRGHHRTGRAARPRPSLQQLHRSSRRMEIQWRSLSSNPNPSEWSHQNNLLGSVELAIGAPSGWQHRLTAFDSLYRYTDTNLNSDSLDLRLLSRSLRHPRQSRRLRISGRLFRAHLGPHHLRLSPRKRNRLSSTIGISRPKPPASALITKPISSSSSRSAASR